MAVLKDMKSQLVAAVPKRVRLSTKLRDEGAEFKERPEYFSVARAAVDRFEGLVHLTVGQYVVGFDAIIKLVGYLLVDRARTDLESAYTGSALSSHYTLTHTSGLGPGDVQVHCPAISQQGW